VTTHPHPPPVAASRWRHWVWAALGALAAGGIARWPAWRNYYGKRGEVDFELDVPYANDRDPKRQLDLYLPRHASRAFPLLLFIHGGYRSTLDRRWYQPLLGVHGNIGVAFARRGVGTAILGYRQYPQVQRGDDSLDDIAAAIRYVRDSAQRWGGDRSRVFVMGHSAGGHLAALLALDDRILSRQGMRPSEVAGFIALDGIFDLGAALAHYDPEDAKVVRALFGPDDGALSERSPLEHACATHPPLLFVDSTDDALVCRESFFAMRARMRECQSPARFVELPGLGHSDMTYRIGMEGDVVTPLVLEFIREAGGARAVE
jgi:acetyl esterase/lipase